MVRCCWIPRDVALQCLCCQSVSPLQTFAVSFWCSAWSNGKHHAFLPLVCQVLLWYYCCPNFAQSAPRHREITVWTVYMFAATFFWSRVKCFWEIWNFWNTREPRKKSMQALGRLNNTIECIVWVESVIMTPDWCADLGSTGLWLLSVKAMKLEHRCWCALVSVFIFLVLFLSLSLSLLLLLLLSLSRSLVWSIAFCISLYFGGRYFWKAMQLAFDPPVPAASASSLGEAGHESFCSVLYEFWSG